MKISAVHVPALTLNFILFLTKKKKKKTCSFLVIFQLTQHKNAHISAHRQKIYVVGTLFQGVIWYTFYFVPLKFLFNKAEWVGYLDRP